MSMPLLKSHVFGRPADYAVSLFPFCKFPAFVEVGLSFIQAHSENLFLKSPCSIKDIELNSEAAICFFSVAL